MLLAHVLQILYSTTEDLFDIWYLSFSMCGHFLYASSYQLRQLCSSSLELGISLFNPRKDFLDIFGQSGAMAQRACKATGPFIWSWICHINLFFSPNLDLSLVYELETLVFVTADFVDSIISISAGLAAVVLCQTLGPVDFFEWSHVEAVAAPCLLQPVEGCHHCCRPRGDLVNLPLFLLFKALRCLADIPLH